MLHKKQVNESFGHEMFVIGLFLIIIGFGYYNYLGYKANNEKEKVIAEKQVLVDKAYQKVAEANEEVVKAYQRKDQLEKDAKKIQEKIDGYEKRIQEVRNQYKRLDRIQKDLDRIIGK